MLHLLYLVVIALTNNLDNLGARISYSLRGTQIGTSMNVWISAITFLISDLAASSGTLLSRFFTKREASMVSMLLLSTIGSWMIVEQYLRGTKTDPDEPNKKTKGSLLQVFPGSSTVGQTSRRIGFAEATVLGTALSINNIGGGLSAGMIGLSPFWVGLLSAVLSFAALSGGNYIAEYCTRRQLSDKTAFVAGSVLIAIGIGQIL